MTIYYESRTEYLDAIAGQDPFDKGDVFSSEQTSIEPSSEPAPQSFIELISNWLDIRMEEQGYEPEDEMARR